MSDTVTTAVIGGGVTLILGLSRGLWVITRYFLDQHRTTETAAKDAMTAKDAEIKELNGEVGEKQIEIAKLRARVRELERECERWRKQSRP